MKDKKWWIFIAVMIVLIIALLIFKGTLNKEENVNTTNDVVTNLVVSEFVTVEEDGTKVNTSEKFATTKTIEGLEISNIKLTEKGNNTQILADVKNTTNKKVEGFFVTISFLDKNGEMMVGLTCFIPTVEANGTATLNTNSQGNFANAYDYTVTRANVE